MRYGVFSASLLVSIGLYPVVAGAPIRMAQIFTTFLIGIIPAGFAAQFIDGTLGMGYGVSSTSLLVAIGLAPAIASASVHTAEIVTTLVSGVAHHQLGNVKKELVLPLVIPGVIGGVLGAYFLSSISTKTIKPWVAGLLLAMGCLIVYRFLRRTKRVWLASNCADPRWLSSAWWPPSSTL